nr:MAG TPA: hypothetical protein [Caudoviricetes sp.]
MLDSEFFASFFEFIYKFSFVRCFYLLHVFFLPFSHVFCLIKFFLFHFNVPFFF